MEESKRKQRMRQIVEEFKKHRAMQIPLGTCSENNGNVGIPEFPVYLLEEFKGLMSAKDIDDFSLLGELQRELTRIKNEYTILEMARTRTIGDTVELLKQEFPDFNENMLSEDIKVALKEYKGMPHVSDE